MTTTSRTWRRSAVVAFAAALLAAVVTPAGARRATTPATPQAAQAAPNIPPEIQPPTPTVPEGFTSIFNGKDLTGWHVSKTNHHGITPDFRVMHGMIVGSQRPLGQGGILLTDKTYRDVEVYIEIKPDYGCDSGLFLRSNEAGDAYQVTLDYLPGGGMGGIYGEGLTGVQNANAPAPARGRGQGARGQGAGRGQGARADAPPPVVGGIPLGSTTPIGDAAWMKVWKREDWNTVRARIEGEVPHIVVWINGTQVTDFLDVANHAADCATEGHISIQIHGGTRCEPGTFWRWRAIGVKEL